VTADDAHHQPAAGAGVAEVEGFARGQKRADAYAAYSPCAWGQALDNRAQRLASLASPEHVVALKQPFDLRLAASEKAK
jgi:hypothetical protein